VPRCRIRPKRLNGAFGLAREISFGYWLPLWLALEPDEKIALIAHELLKAFPAIAKVSMPKIESDKTNKEL